MTSTSARQVSAAQLEVFVERLAALVPAPQKNQVHTRCGAPWGVCSSPSLAEPHRSGWGAPKEEGAGKQSGKPPGFDERWVPWEELMHRVFGRDVVSCPTCGSRIWLVDQVVDPLSARLELAVLGMSAPLISFRPARGPPESLLP